MSDLLQTLKEQEPLGPFGTYTGNRNMGIDHFPGYPALPVEDQVLVNDVRENLRTSALILDRNSVYLFEYQETGLGQKGKYYGYTVRTLHLPVFPTESVAAATPVDTNQRDQGLEAPVSKPATPPQKPEAAATERVPEKPTEEPLVSQQPPSPLQPTQTEKAGKERFPPIQEKGGWDRAFLVVLVLLLVAGCAFFAGAALFSGSNKNGNDPGPVKEVATKTEKELQVAMNRIEYALQKATEEIGQLHQQSKDLAGEAATAMYKKLKQELQELPAKVVGTVNESKEIKEKLLNLLGEETKKITDKLGLEANGLKGYVDTSLKQLAEKSDKKVVIDTIEAARKAIKDGSKEKDYIYLTAVDAELNKLKKSLAPK